MYFPNVGYPDGGKMTMAMQELFVGDEVEMKGPFGSFEWKGRGKASWKGKERTVKEVGMVCGGSGKDER